MSDPRCFPIPAVFSFRQKRQIRFHSIALHSIQHQPYTRPCKHRGLRAIWFQWSEKSKFNATTATPPDQRSSGNGPAIGGPQRSPQARHGCEVGLTPRRSDRLGGRFERPRSGRGKYFSPYGQFLSSGHRERAG